MILRAKYVMPSSHEAFENGAVRVVGDEIVEVGDFERVAQTDADDVLDLGEVALLPGFINAHAHLELGHLAGKLPRPDSFTSWLRDVRQLRETDAAKVKQTVKQGVRASLEAGTTTLVDVTHTGQAFAPLKNSPIRARVEFETLGFDGARTEAASETLRERLKDAEPDPLTTVALSPHAPYSTSATLYEQCIDLSRRRGFPLSSHVAETEDEERFVREGAGPFRDLLESLGVSLKGWKPSGRTPVQYLHELGFFACAPLLIHGNYIRDEDIPILRDLNITVVYCPRSHDYFGHGDHPFEKLFSLGVNIALGTDSLGSAPSLNMLDEMRFIAREYPHVSPERIMTFAMLNGAKTMKVGAKIGGLRAGWKADIVGVSFPNGRGRICSRLLSDEARVVFTMVDGAICYRNPN